MTLLITSTIVLMSVGCKKKPVITSPEPVQEVAVQGRQGREMTESEQELKRKEILAQISTTDSKKDAYSANSVSFPNAQVAGYMDNPTPIIIGSSNDGGISKSVKATGNIERLQRQMESLELDQSVAPSAPKEFNTEEYNTITENEFKRVSNDPLSTFSIDVDGASFSNARRFLMQSNRKPPVDAVRIEEFINYFSYNYPQPTGDKPFSITTQLSPCPWNTTHKLVHIGLQGKKIDLSKAAPTNLVFLLDVSGSMSEPNKLPLLKQSLALLVDQMRPTDRIAMVVYAGAAGVVLPSTPASQKEKILEALERLNAGGSTAGGAGIEMAYKVAKENFIHEGNNRVILATDGDFNVGVSSESELVRLIESKRDEKIFLTVLGFGSGNYSDARMEQLSNKGNGNYAYIDNLLEAKKVLVTEMGATMFTIAKDVKLQVEFNPKKVASYRLIGYENRKLNNEDFNDDTKDAGELGAGHTVTALYEIVPVGAERDTLPTVDPLKYQNKTEMTGSNDLLTVKFRYKAPESDTSKLIEKVLTDEMSGGSDMNWATSMAGFGMLLRGSKFAGDLSWEKVLTMARNSRGEDREGYRAEAIRMIEQAQIISGNR